MDRQKVKEILIGILRDIQDAGGYPRIEINDLTSPIDELEGFDSKVWPVSITLLCKKLGIDIPKRARLYEDENGKSLTITQVVDRLIQVINIQLQPA
jgi:hypothetical protein